MKADDFLDDAPSAEEFLAGETKAQRNARVNAAGALFEEQGGNSPLVRLGKGFKAVDVLGRFLGNKVGLVSDDSLRKAAEDFNVGADPRIERVTNTINDSSGFAGTAAALWRALSNDPGAVAGLALEQVPTMALSLPVGGVTGSVIGNVAGRLGANAAVRAGVTGAGVVSTNTAAQSFPSSFAEGLQQLGATIESAQAFGAKKAAAEAGIAALFGPLAAKTVGGRLGNTMFQGARGGASEMAETLGGNTAVGQDTTKGDLLLSGVLGSVMDLPEAAVAQRAAGTAVTPQAQALADAINGFDPSTLFPTAPTPVTQPAGPRFDPVAAAAANAQPPAPAIPQLGFDPTVQNQPAPIVVDSTGTARPMSADEFLAADTQRQEQQDMGLTPDVQRAIAARNVSKMEPTEPLPSDLVERLRATGWTPPQEVFAAIPNMPQDEQAQVDQANAADLEKLYQQDVKDGIKQRLGLEKPPAEPEAKPASYADSPFLREIAARGGVNMEQRNDTSVDANRQTKTGRVMPNPYNIAGKPLFRPEGLRGDALVESLVSQGYLSQAQVDEADAGGVGGSDQLAYDMIRKELESPGSVKPINMQGDVAQQAAQQRASSELDSKARSIGLDTKGMSDDQINLSLKRIERRLARSQGRADVAREVKAEPGNMSEADAMRALGFTDQEIQDAVLANRPSPAQARPEDASQAAPNETAGPQGSTPADARGEGGQRPDVDPQGLTSYTPEELRRRDQRIAEQARVEARQQAETEAKASADSQRGEFALTGSDRPADVAAAGGQTDIFSQAAPALDQQQESAPAPRVTPVPSSRIEDSGEVLEGARKLYAKAYADKLAEGASMDLATQPLSKTWPEPDYQRMLDGGTDPWAVAFVHAARDEVPNKPSKSWKLKGWVEKVQVLRDLASKALDGKHPPEMLREKGKPFHLQNWFNKVDLYEAVGHARSLKEFTFEAGSYGLHNGQKFDPPKTLWTVTKTSPSNAFGNWGTEYAAADTKAQALEQFKEKFLAETPQESAKPATSFDIYSYRNKPGFVIGKKVGRTYIDLKTFDSAKEARTYKAEHQAELEQLLERAKEIPPERRAENAPRVGDDHRQGADVSTEQFREAFGFRGEQFGASMPQGERQSNLNQAYDALMDLAGVVGVPPRALSLNGELGFAFGSRGKGGKNAAAAHYERDTIGEVTPNRVVINLTRNSGAGSLAHEWFHAVDNYFARMRQEKGGMLTERPHEIANKGVRPEMIEAFSSLMRVINNTGMKERSQVLDNRRTKPYWTTGLEMAARAFESYVIAKLQDQNKYNDYLANVVDEALFALQGAYPYPSAGELPAIRAAFQHFFDTVQTRETETGVAMYSRPEDAGTSTPDTIRTALRERFGDLIPKMEARGFLKIWPSTQAFNDGQTSEKLEGPVQGYWDGKQAHLFADGIAPGNEVAVLLHEVGEHASMEDMLGPVAYESLVRRANDLVDQGDPTAIRAMERIPDDTPRQYVDSELLAYMIETVAADGAKAAPGARKWLADTVAAIRAWFSQTGFNKMLDRYGKGLQLTPADIAALAVRAVKWQAEQGASTAPGGKMATAPRPAQSTAAQQAANVFGGMAPPAAGNPRGPSAAATTPWSVAEPGRLDDLIRRLQDSRIDIKRTVESVKATGAQIADDANPYLMDELYIGKVRAQIDTLADDHVMPMLRAISNSGFTPAQVNDYLWARHAEERNRQMAKVNNVPFDPALDLAGMSSTDARAKLAAARALPNFTQMQAIARMVDTITSDARTRIVTDGLEDASVIQAWEGAYKNYVPLQRDVEESGGKASGYNVKGSESRRAVGSTKEAVNILANVIAQAEATIIRAEKAAVGRSVLDMARQNPNPDFWTVDTPPTERAIDPRTGLVTTRVKPNYKNANNVFVVKEAGVEHFVTFNDKNPRAVQFVRSLKNMDAANLGPVMSTINRGARYLAQWVTARNPLFWMTNFARDVQGVAFNLQSTPLKGQAPQVMAKIPQALAGVASNKLKGSGRWATLAQEFADAGGQTGYLDNYRDSVERMGEIEKDIARMQQGKADPRRIARAVLDVVDSANDTIENGVRLAVYAQAREEGISQAQAASIAKNISVNFNRKGNDTAMYNSLYMFFNANVQGNVRMIQGVMNSRRSQMYAAALTLAGASVALLNWQLGGDDEESRKKRYELVPEYERERNWIVFIPGTDNYVKIPLPLGPHILFNAGRVLSELGLEKDADPMEKAASFASSLLGAFNPIGGGLPSADAKGVAQVATPTIARPVVDLVVNQNFAGTPIAKEETPYGYQKPANERTRDNTPEYWTTAAKAMNDWSGGDDVKPGTINLTGEQVAYLLKGYVVPGIAQSVDKVAAQATSRKETPPDQIIGVSKFFGTIDANERQRAFWDTVRKDSDKAGRYAEYLKAGERQKANELLTQWGGGDMAKGRKLLGDAKNAEKIMAGINKERRAVKDLPEDVRNERLNRLDERMQRTQAIYLRNRAALTEDDGE